MPRPGRFTPVTEIRYPLYRRLGGPQGRSGRVWKISPLPEFDPQTFQPVASRYTDWAIPAPNNNNNNNNTAYVECKIKVTGGKTEAARNISS